MSSRSKRKTKRLIGLFIALVHLQTQVVFAGLPALPLAPGLDLTKTVKLRLKNLSDKALGLGLTLFNAFPYSNLIDPRGRTDIPGPG